MSPVADVAGLEIEQLEFQLRFHPQQRVVQTLPANGSEQSFSERLGHRYVRHRPDFIHLEYVLIDLPWMEPKPWGRDRIFCSWASRLLRELRAGSEHNDRRRGGRKCSDLVPLPRTIQDQKLMLNEDVLGR